MKKQIISLVVVICMLLVCIPFTAAANEATGNITVLYIEGVDALANPNGDGWSFDASTGTLTLTNCNLTNATTRLDHWESSNISSIIYVMGDLTIELVGDNVILSEVTTENMCDEYTNYYTIYSDLYWDENDNPIGSITFTGNGTISVGLSVDSVVYHDYYGVGWSSAIGTSNEGGVDFTQIGENGSVEVFGGVPDEPSIYNIKALSGSPTYNDDQLVLAYQDIEATIPNEFGYNWNNNDAWNLRISNAGAGIACGMLNIVSDNAAQGEGWNWEDNVLTLDSIDITQIYIGASVSSTKIVLNDDLTINNSNDWSSAIINEGGPLEISAGDYELNATVYDSNVIDSYNDVTISSGTVNLTVTNEYSNCIYVSGNLTIENATFNAIGGGIDLYSRWDDELGESIGGEMSISDSSVTVDAPYENQNGISIESSLDVSDSTLSINAWGTAIYTNLAIITDSTVTANGGDYGIQAYSWMDVYSSNVSASGASGAINAGISYEGADSVYTDAIYLVDSTITSPTGAIIGLVQSITEWGDTKYCMAIVDADGNIATDVVIKAQKPIEYNIINGKLVITVITEAGFNRVALYNENNVCIETTNSYVLNGDKYIWTITTSAPSTESTYVVKARDAATNSYKNGITFDAFTVIPEVVIESVETQIRGDRVYVTVTTVSENYDRVAVYNASSGACVKYTKNYEEVDGTYVWTIVFNYDESTRDYIVRARDIRTGTYNKAQEVTLTISVRVEPIIDVQITEYDEENILITVTTIPDIYRVKVADAEAPASCIDYARTPATKDAYNWTWEIIVPRFEDGGYAIDVAYTKAAYARYYTYIA